VPSAKGCTSSGGFGEPEQWRFDWEKTYSTGEWLEQIPAFSGHNLTPPDKLDELLEGIGADVDVLSAVASR
jgi:hypothetical protein